ncbi:MAG TPA: phosphatase [Saprospirales bacterium]|nr:phosphatase [Saprospirales bacterium]
MHTLFLDRDGVINHRIPGDYVKTPHAFQPVEGLEEAMKLLSAKFRRIFVVTNQAGIGKGLMTEMDLHAVHRHMLDIIEAGGGRVDRVYHCPHRAELACTCRKPATGMAWMALADFPDIDLEHAWMVGDSISDMQFAEKLGIKSVLIRGKMEELDQLSKHRIDYHFDALLAFAQWISC